MLILKTAKKHETGWRMNNLQKSTDGALRLDESIEDPFYKMRSDGEQGDDYIHELPNFAFMVPWLGTGQELRDSGRHSATLTHEELLLVLCGFDFAMGVVTGQQYPSEWEHAARSDPTFIAKLRTIRGKLLTAYDSEVVNKPHGVLARSGAGRKKTK